MLIILAGLPGTGKTTIAKELARQLQAVHIRIDSIEQALREASVAPLNDRGYRVGYRLAEDNLKLGRIVIADSVNPVGLTRDAWMDVAKRAASKAVEIELVCSDADAHRYRIESRVSDIPGLPLPTWQEIVAREYHEWHRERIVVDTAHRTVQDVVEVLRAAMALMATATHTPAGTD